MACWNLENGKCKRTDRVCDSNEFACPIAKDERRVAMYNASYYGSRNSGGSSGIGIVGVIIGIVVVLLVLGVFGNCIGCVSCSCNSCYY